jgi:diguanylate cyclase (GGDEF)-like protein
LVALESAAADATAHTAAADTRTIDAQLAGLFISAVPMALLAVVINATVLGWLLKGSAPTPVLTLWLSAVAALSVIRYLDYRRARAHRGDAAALLRHLPRTQAEVLLSGGLWGAASILLFPADNVAHQAVLTVMLAGLAAGSVNTFSVCLRISWLLLALMLVPLLVRMALQQTEAGYAIALLTLLYLGLMLNIAQRHHRTVVNSLRVRHARERAEATVVQQAYYDPLTTLPNRRLLCDRLQLDLARHAQQGQVGGLLYLDIDRFALINNSFGHDAGNDLIQALARRINDLLGGVYTIARIEGDRFVIVLTELGDTTPAAANRARQRAENLRRVLAMPLEVEGRDIQLTVSIGIALFPGDGDTPDDLLRAAESALTQAKGAGRDCTRFYLPQMQAAAKARMDLEGALRRALRGGDLTLFYQPQCDRQGRIVTVEALIRWPRSDGAEMVASPGVFVPLAEDSGMIHELGEWVLYQALRDMRSLDRETDALHPQRVALNVSPAQFRQADFAGALAGRLLAEHLDPHRLELELTEHVLVADFRDTAKKMTRLRELGVHFSVDDFGTGYSSLSYLKRLPLDALKIDRSFVRDVATDASDATIVETIIDMAHRLGLRVVAEGVDKPAVQAFLEARGCDRYQGFLLYRPMPLATLVRVLLQQASAADTG